MLLQLQLCLLAEALWYLTKKECCCSFGLLCSLQHCGISQSQQRQAVYNARTSLHIKMTNAFATIITRNIDIVVVAVAICYC